MNKFASYVDLIMIFAEFEFKCIGLLEQSFVSTDVGWTTKMLQVLIYKSNQIKTTKRRSCDITYFHFRD